MLSSGHSDLMKYLCPMQMHVVAHSLILYQLMNECKKQLENVCM